jgi:signal transduction histidine kinase
MKRVDAVRAADAVVVTVLVVSALVQVWSTPVAVWVGGRAVHSLLAVLITVPLLVRRRHALLVLVTVVAASWLQLELGGELGQPFFALLLALYAVGANTGSPQTYAGPVLIAVVIVGLDVPRLVAGEPLDEVVPVWFVLAGTWGFGRWMRRRGVETAALAARAEIAEREREEQAARAVAQERARIARELHDLVAHSMGVIVIQSQGAQRTLDTNPERVRESLRAIETTSRDGLSELRRLLGLLTDPDTEDADGPQPSLDRLEDLVAQVREAGLPIELTIEAKAAPQLAPGVQLAAYRIVQEALTNILKHAGPASACVTVQFANGHLEVEVTDDGAGPRSTTSPGHGLVGMRERVVLYGGALEAGGRPDGGYRIHARLPVGGETR